MGWLGGYLRDLRFVLELGRDAFSRTNVRTSTQVNRLVDAAGFLERVQVAVMPISA